MNQATFVAAGTALLRKTLNEWPGAFGTAASTCTPATCCCKVTSTRLALVSATPDLVTDECPAATVTVPLRENTAFPCTLSAVFPVARTPGPSLLNPLTPGPEPRFCPLTALCARLAFSANTAVPVSLNLATPVPRVLTPCTPVLTPSPMPCTPMPALLSPRTPSPVLLVPKTPRPAWSLLPRTPSPVLLSPSMATPWLLNPETPMPVLEVQDSTGKWVVRLSMLVVRSVLFCSPRTTSPSTPAWAGAGAIASAARIAASAPVQPVSNCRLVCRLAVLTLA